MPFPLGKSCDLKLLVFFVFFAISVTSAVVVVKDNGYQNILVTFSPDTDKKDQLGILLATKDLITLASSVVYKATGGIYFDKVLFLLPYTWGTLEDWSRNVTSGGLSNVQVSSSSADEVFDEANILVEDSSNTVYGTKPFTLQNGGCGSEGVRISVPKDFILGKEIEDENAKAKILAREWIRYRYGVFYENGYLNDDLYPLYSRLPGSDDQTDIKITDCTNKPIQYSFKDSSGDVCTLEVEKSGLPRRSPTTCSFYAEKENNSDVISSLMYVQDLPSIVDLCDDRNHNADVPNKQNLLCKGRSIMSVLKDHPDFLNRQVSNVTSSPGPQFKLVVDRNPRIVLAVDKTSAGDSTERIARKTVQKFLYDLPDETEFALLRFDSSPSTTIPFGLLNQRGIVSFPFNAESPSYPNSAIEEALKILTNDSIESKGMIVILASANATLTTNPELTSRLKSSQICLSVVVLDGFVAFRERYRELLDASPCSHFWAMPPSDNEELALKNMMQLNEELERVIGLHTYHNAKQTVATQVIDTLPVSFEIERSVNEFQIWLSNAKSSLQHSFDDSSIFLENARAENVPMERIIEKLQEIRVYQVSNNEGGKFNLRIEEIARKSLPILLEVVAKESYSASIRVRTWVKEGSSSPEQMPVVLYAEVTMGVNPILNAEVKASITTPDQITVELYLLDNGLGDPDVTKYDGIYTRYFTQFPSAGDYHVSIIVSDNEGQARTAQPPVSGPSDPCCGSVVPTGVKQDTGPFKKLTYAKFSTASGRPEGGYKPSRVQDLRITSWDDPRHVSLSFSSPGNEMDQGTAKEYIFRLFRTSSDAENRFEEENELTNALNISDPVIPKEYPEIETVRIELIEEKTPADRTYFLAMRSVSSEQKQSDTSNVVQLFIPAVVSSTPSPTSDGINTGDDDGDSGTSKSKTASSNAKTIGIVVGVCVLVIIIFVCAYLAFYLLVVKPRRKRAEEERSSTPAPKKTDVDDGTVPATEWQVDGNSISPINSWPSEVLVNHHEKVKEAKRKNQKPPVFNVENLQNSPDVICTISNGLLPNPIYSSHEDDLNEGDVHDPNQNPIPLQQHSQENQITVRPSRKVSHV